MAYGEANRVQLSYIAETTFGVKKESAALQILRHTGESLKQDTGVSVSNEIRSDRQVAGLNRNNVSASGGINFELSYGSYDDLLAAALMASTWSTAVTVSASTISAAVADNSFNDSANGFGSLVAGQWVKVSGFTTVGNNGYFKIATKAAGKITVAGGTLTDEAAGDAVVVKMGAQVTNGTTKTSFNIERKYADLSNELALFLGMMVDGFSLNVTTDAIVTGSMDFVGKSESSQTATGGSGYTAATTTVPMNAIDNVLSMLENMAAVEIQGFSIKLSNNLRGRQKVGTLGAFDVASGKVAVTGSVQAYFTSKTLFDKYLNMNNTGIAFVVQDQAGNGYVIEVPSLKFTSGDRPAAGSEQDIIANMDFTAYMSATESITIRIARFAAA